MAILFVSWKAPDRVPDMDSAISIANTYIVFTTFIFVAFTVLLTIVGYVLAQTFSTNAVAHHSDAIEKIKDCISNDDEKATQVLEALLSSPQVQGKLSKVIREKVIEELEARRADIQMTNHASAADLQTLATLLSQPHNEKRPNANGHNNGAATPHSATRQQQERFSFRDRYSSPRRNNDDDT